jgi:hypothetical protein
MRFILVTLLAGLLVSPLHVFAISSTDQVAWAGKPVAAEAHWGEGVLELVNDPLRGDGWHPWFSEWPNDVNYYEMKASKLEEINHLITQLAAIKASKVQILLNPAREAGALAFTTTVKIGSAIPAVFSIGDQGRIDQWFDHLKKKEGSDKPKFGVYTIEKAPEALPPTLTLYVGHAAVDLKKLKIPERVQVTADVSKSYREQHEGDPSIKAIEDYVASRSALKAPN